MPCGFPRVILIKGYFCHFYNSDINHADADAVAADVDADAVTPSSNTMSYTRQSVPFLTKENLKSGLLDHNHDHK